MASLQILKGPNEGSVIPLDGDRFVLGRNPDCAVVIPVTAVSREHSQIVKVGGRFFIEDNKSRNGTFVNNLRIEQRVPLKDKDRIRICDFIAAFLDPASAPEGGHDPNAWPGMSERYPHKASLEAECRSLREALEVNHIRYNRAESLGLHDAVATPSSPAQAILGAGFHRLVVVDAEKGRTASGAFDLDRFLRHVYEELARACSLELTPGAYHAETVAQLLKDEPRSLFCFLNMQLVGSQQLRRLRGFTQELHQVLFLCKGEPDVELDAPDDPNDESVHVFATSGEAAPAEKLRLLLEISGNLSRTLELNTLLPKIADSLFQVFRQADRCFLIVTEGEQNEKLQPRVVKTRRAADESNARFSRSLVRKCIQDGSAFLSDDASRDDRIQLSQSVVDFRIRSVMCVPLLRADGKAFGVIQLDTQDRSKKFTQEDLKLLCGVANQASISLENARLLEEAVKQERMRRDLQVAQQLQLAFLPSAPPKLAGYSFHAHYQAAIEVGGDSYDYVPLADGRICVTIADVAGKGIAASLLMTALSRELRAVLLVESNPVSAIARLNDRLHEVTSKVDRFITLAAVFLDPRAHTCQMISAGMDLPLLYRAKSGELADAMPKESGSLPLGLMDGVDFEAVSLALGPGDSLLLRTDGVAEARNLQEADFSDAAVRTLFQGVPGLGPIELVDRLVTAVRRHSAGRNLSDDFTVVAFGRDAE